MSLQSACGSVLLLLASACTHPRALGSSGAPRPRDLYVNTGQATELAQLTVGLMGPFTAGARSQGPPQRTAQSRVPTGPRPGPMVGAAGERPRMPV